MYASIGQFCIFLIVKTVKCNVRSSLSFNPNISLQRIKIYTIINLQIINLLFRYLVALKIVTSENSYLELSVLLSTMELGFYLPYVFFRVCRKGSVTQ